MAVDAIAPDEPLAHHLNTTGSHSGYGPRLHQSWVWAVWNSVFPGSEEKRRPLSKGHRPAQETEKMASHGGHTWVPTMPLHGMLAPPRQDTADGTPTRARQSDKYVEKASPRRPEDIKKPLAKSKVVQERADPTVLMCK